MLQQHLVQRLPRRARAPCFFTLLVKISLSFASFVPSVVSFSSSPVLAGTEKTFPVVSFSSSLVSTGTAKAFPEKIPDEQNLNSKSQRNQKKK